MTQSRSEIKRKNSPMISAIIPAFNEEKTVGNVVRSALNHVDEVVVVDDCSTDGTSDVAADAGAEVIKHQRNMGVVKAIGSGFEKAKGEILITLDADGQHDPADIPLLIEPILNDQADLVLGRRPSIPHFSERFITSLTRFRVDCSDASTGFRAIRRHIAMEMKLRGSCLCGTFILEADRLGARIAEVPITIKARREGGRRIQTRHLKQIFHVLYELIRA